MAKRLRRDSDVFKTARTEEDATLIDSSPASTAPPPKYASLEPEDVRSRMDCLLPPHKPLAFATYAEYESHYQHTHTNRCADCKKNLPSGHFLDLHIAENHDPILAAKRDAGEKTYACFVEDCDKVCSEWKKRRSHLVDKHGYPKNYDFLVVESGIDGRRSLLRPGIDAQGHRKSSRERDRSGSSVSTATQTTQATSVREKNTTPNIEKLDGKAPQGSQADDAKRPVDPADTGMDDLTSSMSAMKMVPRSVTFGKRKGRSGFAKS